MTTIEAEWVFQFIEAFACHFIAAIGEPTIGLEEDCRAKKLVRIPPIAGATGRATSAQNTLVQAIELLTLFR